MNFMFLGGALILVLALSAGTDAYVAPHTGTGDGDDFERLIAAEVMKALHGREEAEEQQSPWLYV